MAKMYASTIIKNVTIFKDFNFSIPYNGFMDEFDVEFIKNKARVICTSSLVDKNKNTTRLNKVHQVASWTGGGEEGRYGYSLIANGQQVYFIVNYNTGNIDNWSDELINRMFEYYLDEMETYEANEVRNSCVTLKDKHNFLIEQEKKFKDSFK